MKNWNFIWISIAFCSGILFSCRLEKGFQALDVYNYFAAKELFENSLKKDEVAASYGLSIIYLRDDNPFFNLDSSLTHITKAADGYSSLKPKLKKKYEELKVDSLTLFNLRNEVSYAHYQRAVTTNSVEQFEKFLTENKWSVYYDSVIYLRDELAFNLAEAEATSKAYAAFLKNYPNSVFIKAVQSAYDRVIYREKTDDNTIVSYIAFIKEYPESPYRYDAEDQVYNRYTQTGTLNAYKGFIKDHPTNRNVSNAWKEMFNSYLQNDYSSASLKNFLEEFEDYPFKEDLKRQLELADIELLPIKKRNKWGYVDKEDKQFITLKYESAETFHEGLAIVSKNGHYGFINKSGEMVIDAFFDDAYRFSEGHAVVEVDEKWGMINRNGEFVIHPRYEDLGNLTDGLAYFAKGELYGYFDAKGIQRLRAQYTAAEDFQNGKAIVSRNDLYGLIDPFGTTTIPFKYNRLKKYEDGIFVAQLDYKWGLISENGKTLLDFEYDYIGKLSNNRAIVEKNNLFNYIDLNGTLLLEKWLETYPEYKQLAVFQNGHARIKLEDGYNLMDTTGTILFRSGFDDLRTYSNLIAVEKEGEWGYLNPKGKLMIRYNFTSAQSFKNGKALAGGAPLVGVIDVTGKYIIEPYFEQIEWINDTLAIAKSRGSYGMLTAKGDTLLPFLYTSIELYDQNIVQLETMEALFYYTLGQNKFLRKEN